MTQPTLHHGDDRDDTTLVVTGADLDDDEVADRLYEAGFDDATIGSSDGIGLVDLHRGRSVAALLDAIDRLEAAVPGARVVRVEPDDLVAAAEIPRRLRRSRESVVREDPRWSATRKPSWRRPVPGPPSTASA